MTSERENELFNRYFDLSLSEEDKRELEAALRVDAGLRRRFCEAAQWHATLAHWGKEQIALTHTGAELLDAFPATTRHWPLDGMLGRGAWFGRLVAIAASVAVLLGAGLYYAVQRPSNPLATAPAMITYDEHVAWAKKGSRPRSDGGLEPGNYSLAAGTLRLVTGDGAVVTVGAPAEFKLIDSRTITLYRGKLVARMLKEESRLSVTTSKLKLVDLGTAFGVNVDADGNDLVSVFEGKVAVTPLGRQGNEPTVMVGGSSISTVPVEDGASNDWQAVRFENRNFLDLWPLTVGVDDLSHLVHFVPPGPQAEPMRDFRSNYNLFLMPEAQDVVIDESFPFDRMGKQPLQQTAMVDSYLLFFNPEKKPTKEWHNISGNITFTRRIVGVVYRGAGLYKTDEKCGLPGANYVIPNRGHRGIEPQEPRALEPDSVSISADGYTLYFNLSILATCDQIRVLVDAD